MILTVTLNVAVDRTYGVDRVELGAVHRVNRVRSHAGGKGINVARVLSTLGHEAVAAGVVGADQAAAISRQLAAAGIRPELEGRPGPTRQTLTVVDGEGTATAFDEAGPEVSGPTWEAFTARVGALLPDASWLVLAGSIPPGVRPTAYGDLVARAAPDVPALVDAKGEAMHQALSSRPRVVKLNRVELAQTTGLAGPSDGDVLLAVRRLQDRGASAVIVTLGPDGALAAEGESVWRVRHPAASGNPIGAGDAFTAGFVGVLSAGGSFEAALHEGAACGLASLASPLAGEVDLDAVRAARTQVSLQRLQLCRES